MARSQTIITILEELGDEDFKAFKWHLCEDKRIPRQIPYAQLVKLDRVDTSTKIKQSFGTQGGLRFMMLVLEVIDRNDLKERYSPKTSKEPDIDPPDITDGGENSEFRTKVWWHSQDGIFPEETSDRGSPLKMRMFMAVGLLCALVGNILLVVATATDYWHGWHWERKQYNMGLWKECGPAGDDTDGRKCTTIIGLWATGLNTAGAFMILSCMVCFAGIIVSFAQRFKRSLAAGILFIVSTFVALLVMAIYTGMAYAAFQSNINWFFGWSDKLGWVATFMVFFAGIFYMCAYRNRGTGPR